MAIKSPSLPGTFVFTACVSLIATFVPDLACTFSFGRSFCCSVDTVPLLPQFVFVIVVWLQRIILLCGIPNNNGLNNLILLSFLCPASTFTLLLSLESIDIFIENHRRRLHFLAPAFLLPPSSVCFVRPIVTGCDKLRRSEYDSGGGD
jgi:hypothetical protein